LGYGFTVESGDPKMDKSPYLSVDAIDPQWLRAIGHAEAEPEPEPESEVQDLKATRAVDIGAY
jgi:hypothetical protein